MTGFCLTCNQGYIIQNGTCTQLPSPAGILAGCKTRQILGFGLCKNAKRHCANYNLNTGNCDQCNAGFDYDFRGRCTINTNKTNKCSSRQYSVGGLCYDVNRYCDTFNSTNGYCLTCLNGGLPVGGQCSSQQLPCLTGSNQYVDKNGNCQTVDPRCNTFNPTNGFCLSCLATTDNLNNGVCCPSGTTYFNKGCQPITAGPYPLPIPASANDPNCSHYHPSLQYCVACFPGFALSSAMLGQCVRV